MKKIVFILLFFIGWCSAYAQQGSFSMKELIAKPPSPQRLVNDFSNTLTPDQRQALENKLVAIDDSTSTQIAVVIVPSLDGYDVADAATELGTKWGVGGKENNGVVLLICVDPKNRRLNISPGYGLEGALTDLTASHIIEDVIIPNFKGNDYYRGIDEGADAIIKAVKGEYNTPRKKGGKSGNAKIIFIVIIILFLLMASKGGGRGGGFMSRRGYRNITGPLILGDLLGGGRGGGGWGGGSSGGGGFGGFGGGSFGGGGASGSW